MSTRPDPDLAIAAWLVDEARDGASDRLLAATRQQIESTHQHPSWWPARRLREMNSFAKFAVAAAAVAVVAFVGLRLLPDQGSVGSVPSPSASPTASPSTAPASPVASPSASNVPAWFPDSELQAGTYTVAPFSPPLGEGVCHVPPQAGCTENAADDAIRVTITVPDGWSGIMAGIWLTASGSGPPDGASVWFGRGAWLLSDPCKLMVADVPVGPTVADFVDAVAEHPILDTTAPVDVTLAGYTGKYFDLQIPADISMCESEPGGPPQYRPWEPGIYGQGPSQRWRVWVLDVDGVRVLVQSSDYATTTEQRRTELQAIVDSVQIEP
jgi:hypothetical protein